MIATGNHEYFKFAARSTTLPYVPHQPLRLPVSKNVPIFEHLQIKDFQVFSRQMPENRYIFRHRMAMRRVDP